jgi:hypothetical protein
MPTIGLIVDGLFDQKAITALVNRQRPKAAVRARQCGGGRNHAKAVGILREFEHRRLVDFAIWVTDAEDEEPALVETLMAEAVNRARPLRFTIRCVVAVRMLGAWLLADEAAIGRAGGTARRYANPESLTNPKAELRRLFDHPYTHLLAERIASAARLKIIAKRCPSFAKLMAAVSEA